MGCDFKNARTRRQEECMCLIVFCMFRCVDMFDILMKIGFFGEVLGERLSMGRIVYVEILGCFKKGGSSICLKKSSKSSKDSSAARLLGVLHVKCHWIMQPRMT